MNEITKACRQSHSLIQKLWIIACRFLKDKQIFEFYEAEPIEPGRL